MGTIVFLLTLTFTTFLIIGPGPVNYPCTVNKKPCGHLPIHPTTTISTTSTSYGGTSITHPVTVTSAQPSTTTPTRTTPTPIPAAARPLPFIVELRA